MDIQKDKDFTSLPEIAKLYQACKERDLTIAEREYLKGARDAWQAAKAQADETTLGDAIGYFTKLVEDLTQGQITLLPVQKQQLKNAIEEIA